MKSNFLRIHIDQINTHISTRKKNKKQKNTVSSLTLSTISFKRDDIGFPYDDALRQRRVTYRGC